MSRPAPPLNDSMVQGAAVLINATGLHARPSVKLTQLAKNYRCSIEIALNEQGPWFDAKSPVKIMRLKASRGTLLHVRCNGVRAQEALEAVLALARDKFGEVGEGQSSESGGGLASD